MNRWQKCFIERFYNGELPRDQMGRIQFELLGEVKDRVLVHMPAFDSVRGHIPARVVEYEVYEDRCDMPNGIISASVLAGNLYRWNKRGYKIETSEESSNSLPA